MTKVAANVSILYPSLPILDRFDRAARDGFTAVEFWWPRELENGITQQVLARRILDAGLDVALINFDGGDLAAGDRGLAGDPLRRSQFQKNIPVALELATLLGCRKLNALAGRVLDPARREPQLAMFLEDLDLAAAAAGSAGAAVMVEAINAIDVPDYLLPRTADVLDAIERAGPPNLRYQLDTYHVARQEGEVVPSIRLARDRIGHVQIADVPGRHEPGTGSLPFEAILGALAEVGYGGEIGLEYVPSDPERPDFAYLADLFGPAVAAGSG